MAKKFKKRKAKSHKKIYKPQRKVNGKKRLFRDNYVPPKPEPKPKVKEDSRGKKTRERKKQLLLDNGYTLEEIKSGRGDNGRNWLYQTYNWLKENLLNNSYTGEYYLYVAHGDKSGNTDIEDFFRIYSHMDTNFLENEIRYLKNFRFETLFRSGSEGMSGHVIVDMGTKKALEKRCNFEEIAGYTCVFLDNKLTYRTALLIGALILKCSNDNDVSFSFAEYEAYLKEFMPSLHKRISKL